MYLSTYIGEFAATQRLNFTPYGRLSGTALLLVSRGTATGSFFSDSITYFSSSGLPVTTSRFGSVESPLRRLFLFLGPSNLPTADLWVVSQLEFLSNPI